MRKYQYKDSRRFARFLGKMHADMREGEIGAKFFHEPWWLIRDRLNFYWRMLKLRWLLERARRVDFHSESDYLELKIMWWDVFKRTYEPIRN